MRIAPALICTTVLALAAPAAPAASVPQEAPPAPGCLLLTDPRGDARSPALDILGGDLASDRKTVTVLLRLVTTHSDGDPATMLGADWTFAFTLRGTGYSFTRRRQMGVNGTYSYSGPRGHRVTVTVTSTDIRWTVSREAFPELRTRGAVFRDIAAISGASATNADLAATKNTYRDRAPSCTRAA